MVSPEHNQVPFLSKHSCQQILSHWDFSSFSFSLLPAPHNPSSSQLLFPQWQSWNFKPFQCKGVEISFPGFLDHLWEDQVDLPTLHPELCRGLEVCPCFCATSSLALESAGAWACPGVNRELLKTPEIIHTFTYISSTQWKWKSLGFAFKSLYPEVLVCGTPSRGNILG